MDFTAYRQLLIDQEQLADSAMQNSEQVIDHITAQLKEYREKVQNVITEVDLGTNFIDHNIELAMEFFKNLPKPGGTVKHIERFLDEL